MSAEDEGVFSHSGTDQTCSGLAEAVTREMAALAEQRGWSTLELARRARLPVRSVR